jgi:small subunit ribosomal protein S2
MSEVLDSIADDPQEVDTSRVRTSGDLAPADGDVGLEELLKAGVHFGHLTSRWNPQMKPFIFMQRQGIHILDLMQTQERLKTAAEAVQQFARQGKTILFVATKKQARDAVRQHAEECGMPFMVERWYGGTLTNFQTIRGSIQRMEQLKRMETDGTYDQLKKKERLMRTREREKLETVLEGIADMGRLPGALFVVDINREHIAVDEARKLDIPIIALVDTNTNPNLVDYPIPANDDAIRSVDLIAGVVSAAIQAGRQQQEIAREARQAQDDKRRSDEAAQRAEASAADQGKRTDAAAAEKAAEDESDEA